MLKLRQMRRNASGVAILIIVPVALIVWLWSSSGSAAAPTVPTGASFNLTVARYRSEPSAATIARRLSSSGLPAFTRTLHSGTWHQVVVGPYVSIDEAEQVQRRLRGQGLSATMLVDESVRRVVSTGHVAGAEHAVNGGANLVLVGGAGRLSLVMEMAEAPTHVLTPRKTGSLVQVEAGPLAAPVSSRMWNGPDSAGLVNQVAVEGFERDGDRFMRTTVALANPVDSSVRVVGSRVYIDFWPATARTSSSARGPSQARAARTVHPDAARTLHPDAARTLHPDAARTFTVRGSGERTDQVRPVPNELTLAEYQTAIGPAIARFQSVHPFAMAALGSPSPEVLLALEGSLADLEEWIRTIEPPREAAADHAAFVGSVQQVLQLVRAATPLQPPSTSPQP